MDRGASVGNGNSFANGPGGPWSWQNGFQGPRPVSAWTFMEGEDPCLGS